MELTPEALTLPLAVRSAQWGWERFSDATSIKVHMVLVPIDLVLVLDRYAPNHGPAFMRGGIAFNGGTMRLFDNMLALPQTYPQTIVFDGPAAYDALAFAVKLCVENEAVDPMMATLLRSWLSHLLTPTLEWVEALPDIGKKDFQEAWLAYLMERFPATSPGLKLTRLA